MYPYAEESDGMAAVVKRRPLHRDVESDTVFAAARSLISECIEFHENCRFSRDTVLPRRVMDVGQSGDSVRLQVNDTETHASYLALSYCWGEQPRPASPVQPVLLRRDTLQQLVTDIPLTTLQQSVQDAVLVTRELGFRYLWADALCIIQDCEADKGREISQMASIYKNAAVTIAASCSHGAAAGFLSNRGCRPYLPSQEFRIPMPGGQTGTVYLSAEPYEPEHPLDKRGWALQEFMLSSRLLIFSDYELLWQCKEVDLRGVTGKGLDYLQPLESLPWTVFDDDDGGGEDGGAGPDFGNLDSDKIYLWMTIVHQYTERQLTKLEDRLPALTGVTTELEMLWRDSNIYGLWRRWFVPLLAWYKPPGDREGKRCLARAPSWSWASLDGVVCYKGQLTTQDAKVKTLTVSTAELTCRLLEESRVPKKKAHTIQEGPDLVDPAAELRQKGIRNREPAYLLLGTIAEKGVEKGIGLLVVDVGAGYRRIGLVLFEDMALWGGTKYRDITLEPKITG